MCKLLFGFSSAVGLVVLSQMASAATLCVNPAGSSGCTSTIGAAVAAAHSGDTIQVAAGDYKEEVTVMISLSLVGEGRDKVTIDATGKGRGIIINGIQRAPAAGIHDVSISGFTVKNANYEGILAINATGLSLVNNLVTNNNLRLNSSGCPELPAYETNEQMDCGEGLHLMATDHAVIAGNVIEKNSGGILISDETGPSHDNLIGGNTVQSNGFACGITMASHAAAAVANPVGGLSFGVYHNKIYRNYIGYNGLISGGGAGAGVYAPGPGAQAYGNDIVDNTIEGNALPGVAMHNHAYFPMAPPITFRDNTVVGNTIRANGPDTDDAMTAGPTGVNIYSVLPITGIVVDGNIFENESIGISLKSAATDPNGPPPQLQAHLNSFEPNTVGISVLGKASIDGTLNWWGCATGPGTGSCATATRLVSTTPYLTVVPKP